MKTNISSFIHSDNFSYSILLSIGAGRSTGSGFRLKYKEFNFLISAKHVFFNDSEDLYGDTLIATCPSSPIGNGLFIFEVDLRNAIVFKSSASDVCAILLGRNQPLTQSNVPLKEETAEHKRPTELHLETYINVIEKSAIHITSVDMEATKNLNDIEIANEVYLMGYPTSLGIKANEYFDVSTPLIRKGIISGINKAKETFIIDCPSYNGNSGGPIIEHGKDGYFYVIGFVSQYIPYETTWYNNRERIKNVEVANSGFSVCVPFDRIIELIESNIPNI